VGKYTELIFGTTLKKETPKKIIYDLNFILGKIEEKP